MAPYGRAGGPFLLGSLPVMPHSLGNVALSALMRISICQRYAPARSITTWAEHWNADPKPFIWKAAAEEITAKVQRGRTALHQIKSQTDD